MTETVIYCIQEYFDLRLYCCITRVHDVTKVLNISFTDAE